MSRRAAAIARVNGWTVGTILEGAPIMRDGKQIEEGRVIQITAIGEDMVLAKRIDKEWAEGCWEFTSREWKVKEDHGSDS